jgi:hypothetical protein
MKADETTDNVTRINRRQAMKAGLGGAAAAAAVSVPNNEHFSLAPQSARASSQCAPGSTVNGDSTVNHNSANFLTTNCWGAVSGTSCTTWTSPTITVPVASGQYAPPKFTITVGGNIAQTSGSASFTMTGFTLNKPYSKCVVSFAGTNCHGGLFGANGTFTMNNGISVTNTVTGNGTVSGTMYCNGAITAAGTTIVAVTCTCGPD